MTPLVERVAIDSGGTFTDFVVVRTDGSRERFKLPSTPHDPSQAIHEGIKRSGVGTHTTKLHGSTVATNSLLELKGAKIGLITSQGFKDIHELRRQNREDLFAIEPERFPPLIPQDWVFEIAIRPRAGTSTLTKCYKDVIEHFVESLPERCRELDVLVVSLIHGYAHADLEKVIAAAFQARFPSVVAQSAAALVPFSREYERLETALSNAFVQPVMRAYLTKLKQSAEETWAIMASSGGLMTLEEALSEPIRTAISGPAGGVAAAQRVLRKLGARAALTLDMGGTSTDIALVTEQDLGQMDGNVGSRPLRMPMLPIDTIGAGGGSIGRLDDAGILIVGPESAGAFPGPASYGRSDVLLPTITDAHVILGNLTSLLGGQMPLDKKRAYAALESLVCERHPSVESVAVAMIQIANANIVKAVRTLASQSSIRLDETVLFAFGGAGGLHACQVAGELDISKVYFPEEPGVFSAEGIADAPYLHWESEAKHTPIPEHDQLHAWLDSLSRAAHSSFAARHPHCLEDQVSQVIVADCHYRGQSHTLPIELTSLLLEEADLQEGLATAFHQAHENAYGYRLTDAPVLISNLRNKLLYDPWDDGSHPQSEKSTSEIQGPQILSSYGATLCLPAGWSARIDTSGGYLCTRAASQTADTRPPPLEAYRLELISAAEEMGATLKQAAFSPNIKERRDYSCAIFSSEGDLLAQAAHIPVHLGSQSDSVRAVIRSGLCRKNHSVLLNDPYQGGTHLPDITLVSCVEHCGQIVFYVASRAHHADVGGPYPGSMPVPFDERGEPVPLSIDDEGLVIPPTVMSDELRRRVATASRMPAERYGDLRAQEAANRSCVLRLEKVLNVRGHEIQRYNSELLDFGQSQAKALIERFPEGTFEASDVLEDDGHGRAINIRLALTKQDEKLVFDFSKSDRQTASSLNAVRAVTTACMYYAVKTLGGPRLPANEGVLRQLTLTTAPGTVCDAVFPAAVSAGNVETSQRIVDVIWSAFRRALPGQIPAQSCGSMNNVILSGLDTNGEGFVHYETHGGGCGAGPNGPGLSGIHTHMTNTLNTPIEELELTYPLEIVEYSLRNQAEPAGPRPLFHGGSGLIRTYKFLCSGEVTVIGERHEIPPKHAEAPGNAQGASHKVRRKDGSIEELGSKSRVKMNPGDSLILTTADGGSWGTLD